MKPGDCAPRTCSHIVRSACKHPCAQEDRLHSSTVWVRHLEEGGIELARDAGGRRNLVLPGAVRDEAPGVWVCDDLLACEEAKPLDEAPLHLQIRSLRASAQTAEGLAEVRRSFPWLELKCLLCIGTIQHAQVATRQNKRTPGERRITQLTYTGSL